jgi:phosphate transport system substrate-binding protein
MKKEKVAASALLQASNGAVAQAVAKNPKAIGYIGFGYLNSSLKKLNVNGIEASAATALSGTWPIARDLYVFTNGAPAGAVKKLVDYLLDPQKGQKAVLEVGYIPLQK